MEVNPEINEIVDLVHSLVLQSRPPPSSSSVGFDDPLSPSCVSTPSKIRIKSVPNSPCSNMTRTQSLPVRKKVQIKSAPLKPPDIGNSSLFPSMEESVLLDAASSTSSPVGRRISLKSSVCDGSNNSFAISSSESIFASSARDQKMKTLEAKLTEPLIKRQQSAEESSSTPPLINHGRTSLNLNELPTTPSRKTPRSAKLFSELRPDRRQHLDELAEKYAKSIDSNQCRNILDELEFLFQLFNTSTTMPSSNNSLVKIQNNNNSTNSIPLLCSAAEQAYFVIKVVISQLDKLFVSIPPIVLQLIIDNYPHKIPKPVRKHIDDWILKEKENTLKRSSSAITNANENIPVDLVKTVTFQSEKDGRANFLHQTDFHAFCKQRDLFYSIRESWTSSSSSSSSSVGGNGMMTDRSKSRMSFPPPAPSSSGTSGGGSSISSSIAARFVDPLPFKVQSLFQMNRNPTNLFHMASLFVSHYLLEAKAQEMGGVPKDDTMKEFFQSNPTKLLQLNSRFSMNAIAETLEESGSNFAFQKQFLLVSSPKFVQHVVDRLVIEITQVEISMGSVDLSTNPNHVCRTVKDSVHLARLLGFAHFLPYLPDETKQHNSNNIPINSIEKESVLQEHVQLRSYHVPPLDLKDLIEKARQSGRLTTTCPWIIEYLLQCDPVTLLLPSYQPILMTLISLYKSVLTATGEIDTTTMALSNRNFLRFHLGTLFSSKNFPDSVFSLLKSEELIMGSNTELNDASVGQEGLVDLLEEAARSLMDFFFEDTYNRFKRILSWGKLEVSHPAITGEFRHIRPIPASTSSSSSANKSVVTTLSQEKILQSQLEAMFFELYPPPVKRSVDFVAERMAANFMTIAKVQLFPNIRTTLQNQGIFGVRAAEKCRMRIGEEMNKYITERCCLTVKLFLEQNVTGGVLGLCQKIAIRKARETGRDWIKNYINAAMFPEVTIDGESKGGGSIASSQSCSALVAKPPAPEDPPFETLILIHRTLRKLNSLQKIDPQLIDKVLSCQTLSNAPWAFIPLIDWGLSLITFQPQALNPVRTKQLVGHWKNLWNPSASKKILNPRNLMLIGKSDNSRDSWIKLGSVTQLLIVEGLMKAEDLEQQCMELLREDWPDQVHKRISEFLTIVLESFHERMEYHVSESAQVLDWVAWLCSGQPDQD